MKVLDNRELRKRLMFLTVESAWRTIRTPHGEMVAEASDVGLTRLYWGQLSDRPECEEGNVHLDHTEAWVTGYFSKEMRETPKLDLNQLSSFAKSVSMTLVRQVQLGETISYAALASASGHEGAARAVGTVMANNPISLVIPCHRVLKSCGGLGRYSAADGAETKQWLLTHESEW